MNYSAMLSFLTEENIKAHLAYMRTLKLRHSILEKSLPEIKGKSPSAIMRLNIKKALKDELMPNLIAIRSHECYFRSFKNPVSPCPEIRKFYSSEDSFCYEVIEYAKKSNSAFIYIFKDQRGRPYVRSAVESGGAFLREEPILAIDLAEHAYFSDYGFERDKYIRAAVSHLDLGKIFPKKD